MGKTIKPLPRGPDLYTPEQRKRRDSSVWTLVQGVLAPLQNIVFLIAFSTLGFFKQTIGVAAVFCFFTTALIIDKMAQLHVPHSSSKGRGRTSL